MGVRFAQTFLGRQVGLWQPTCRGLSSAAGRGRVGQCDVGLRSDPKLDMVLLLQGLGSGQFEIFGGHWS